MAIDSLNHFSSFVNQQINSLETINDNLAKANALVQVALQEGFIEYPAEIIRDYLYLLGEIVEYAFDRSTTALETIVRAGREQPFWPTH
ncbi:MAG TPA: hypothetical protein VHE99_11250 [Gammaproteobacteria bacterium]|nr:hypothetical protein [Gammaproteobacteria bacterium]